MEYLAVNYHTEMGREKIILFTRRTKPQANDCCFPPYIRMISLDVDRVLMTRDLWCTNRTDIAFVIRFLERMRRPPERALLIKGREAYDLIKHTLWRAVQNRRVTMVKAGLSGWQDGTDPLFDPQHPSVSENSLRLRSVGHHAEDLEQVRLCENVHRSPQNA